MMLCVDDSIIYVASLNFHHIVLRFKYMILFNISIMFPIIYVKLYIFIIFDTCPQETNLVSDFLGTHVERMNLIQKMWKYDKTIIC